MRKLFSISAFLFLSCFGTLFAQEPQPNVLIPSAIVSEIITYLNTRPFGEVSKFMIPLQMCLAVQLPPTPGATVPPDWCQAVRASLAEKAIEKDKVDASSGK